MSTLKKVFDNKAFLIVLGAIIGGLISLLGGVVAQQCSYHYTLELQQNNLRETSYTQLCGLRVILRQEYTTCFEAIINCYYHQYKYFHFSNNAIDYEQMNRYQIRSEANIDIITKTWQDIFNRLAEIKISFKMTPEIDQLILSIINYSNPTIKNPVEGEVQINSPEELENWRKQTIIDIKNYSFFQYDLPIQQLIDELEKQLY